MNSEGTLFQKEEMISEKDTDQYYDCNEYKSFDCSQLYITIQQDNDLDFLREQN